MIACLDRLKELDTVTLLRDEDLDEISSLLVKLNELCSSSPESGNVAIATKHGAVELITCSICSKIKTDTRSSCIVIPCLKALAVLIHGMVYVLELV